MTDKQRTWRDWRYLDGPLIAFVLPMIAAQVITAHGTYAFYSYMLPLLLAVTAMLVLTIGVPLLEFAAVLDKERRGGYIGGMLFLLFLEGMAQYYQSQAHFSSRILQQFDQTSGVDLATLAAKPEGRALPILYLAALSLVVVGFGYAAAARIKVLRERPDAVAESPDLVAARSDLVAARAELEAARSQTATAIQDRDEFMQAMNDARISEAVAMREAEDRRIEIDKLNEARRIEVAELRSQLAVARKPQPPTRSQVVAYAQHLVAQGTDLAKVADQLGFSYTTLRGWMAAATNGHAAEVTP